MTGLPSGDLALETKKFVLQTLLEKAATVLPTRSVSPVLSNFYIEAKENLLQVIATDLELSLVATTEMVVVNRQGSAVLPGRRLLGLVKEAEGGDLLLDVKQGTASVSVTRTVWELQLPDGSEYPPLPEMGDVTMHEIERARFLGALAHVRYAAATETVRPSLMMIDISGSRMRAADGVRFQQIKMPWWPEGFDIQIPIKAVDNLVKLLNASALEVLHIGESMNHLIFRIGSDTFVVNKVVAEFPAVDEIIKKPALANDLKLNVDRQELMAAIRRVRVTADPQTSAVMLDLEKDHMLVRSKDKFGNAAVEELAVRWASPPRQVAFNASHLLDMLNMTQRPSCEFLLGIDKKQRKSPLLIDDREIGHISVLNQLRADFLT